MWWLSSDRAPADVWPIGTRKTATPGDGRRRPPRAARASAARITERPAGDAVRILYGGRVKPDYVRTSAGAAGIDGASGGASPDTNSFASIVNF